MNICEISATIHTPQEVKLMFELAAQSYVSTDDNKETTMTMTIPTTTTMEMAKTRAMTEKTIVLSQEQKLKTSLKKYLVFLIICVINATIHTP